MKFFSTRFASPGKSVASITGIAEADLAGFKVIYQEYAGNQVVYIGHWTSGTFTDSTYNAFPVGSVVKDFVAGKEYWKTGATTWIDHTLS